MRSTSYILVEAVLRPGVIMAAETGVRKRLRGSTTRPSGSVSSSSKRFRDSSVESTERIPSTPPERISSAEFDNLSAAVDGLILTDTPKSRPGPKVGVTGKRLKCKILFPSEGPKDQPKWSDEELRMLTCFIMLYTDGKAWVAHKDSRFWDQVGLFIQQQLHTSHRRSGMTNIW